jgi:hypothetical protein
MESLRRYKTIAFALAYSMGLAVLLYGQLRDWAYDDPFITFRYAENLARGLGFVYNSGERVLSTTTPLFALLLAALSRSGLDLPHLANLIGALSLALGGLALWDLARTWKTPLVGWVGLLLYPSFSLLLTTLGSEMPLYLAFCLGAFAFYARQTYHLTALFIALAGSVGCAVTLGRELAGRGWLQPWQKMALLVFLLAIMLAGAQIILVMITSYPYGHLIPGRYLLTLVIPLSTFLALGLRQLCPRALRPWLVQALVADLILFDVLSLSFMLIPYYYG